MRFVEAVKGTIQKLEQIVELTTEDDFPDFLWRSNCALCRAYKCSLFPSKNVCKDCPILIETGDICILHPLWQTIKIKTLGINSDCLEAKRIIQEEIIPKFEELLTKKDKYEE